MEEEKTCLDILKEEYSQLGSDLPEFDSLNLDFQIEKLSEMETDYLAREIRKFVVEKFSSYLKFIESLLNPVNSSMIVFSIIKALNKEDKEKLIGIYKKLAKFELEVLKLDLDYSENQEIDFLILIMMKRKMMMNVLLDPVVIMGRF
jgi:hypothetical protein